MDKGLQLINRKYENILNSTFIDFNEVKSLKNITGVYMIFDDKHELLYVGHTNKFNIRFGTDLKHEKTHTLFKKLLKENPDREFNKKNISNIYKYKIEICQTKREAEALEHLLIYLLNPKYNK